MTNLKHALKVATIRAQYAVVIEALKETAGHKSKAAKNLGIDRKTLYNILAAHKTLLIADGKKQVSYCHYKDDCQWPLGCHSTCTIN